MSDAPEVALSTPDAPPRRSRGRVLAGIIAVVAVIAGGAFAAVSLGSSDANKPEDPVRAMFAAAEQGDVLGVMEQLDPGERDALKGPLSDIVDELNRLDILKDASLGHLTGVGLQVQDLELSSEELDHGLAHVRITNGKGRLDFDASKLPLGGFVRDLIGDGIDDAKSSETSSLRSTKASDVVTTVKRGDRWYVSIGYSIAEMARTDAGTTRADLGDGVPAKGADTPEAAVKDMIMAGTKLDIRRLIELLPPDELGAVHDYAALFLGQAEQGVADVKDEFSIKIPTLELDASTSGDHATVKITKLAVSADFGGMSFSYKDGCVDIAPPPDEGEPQHICDLENPGQLVSGLGMGVTSELQPPKLSFTGKKVDVGIETTKVDGKWYVSPTRTGLLGTVKLLRLVQRSDLTALRDYYKKLFESFTSSASASLGACQADLAHASPPDGSWCNYDGGTSASDRQMTATTAGY
jgi:hypothetical protein